MVLGILTSIAACPAIIGTTEAVRQGQRQNEREKHRGRKTNLIARCTKKSSQSAQIEGGMVVLRNHKLYITTSTTNDNDFSSLEPEAATTNAHPFTGYFFPHPSHNWRWQGEGMVSTIGPGPPILNWIYVDKDTNEVKYGNKLESAGHVMGPWSCTKIDRRLLFEGWEGFLAVKEEGGVWAVYFDRDDDGLKGVGLEGRKLEVELWRKELRRGKEDKDTRP